ncbi:restriction endonuclease subunit S [Fervidibacillus halotolerans]|uniref:Restriction endonuclease subunit S n=1 Tax=Fervidibacillus halotolerans TaxID=2980027 RepID=A0A9E8LZZ6_9BACI|nr:restriction endonuclease subunit S [Fervidibacillus halotolerans]WAA12822.1 restriction endonuclease subunit S [Fervidibacillus halotolerans]
MKVNTENKKFIKTEIGAIPNDWEVKKINEVAKVNAYNLNNQTSDDYKFFYYDLSSVNKGKISHPLEMIKYSDAPSRAKRLFKKDDILMSTVRPNLQGFAYIDFDAKNCVCSTGFAVITAKHKSDRMYLYQTLYSHIISNQINRLLAGSNYPAINGKDVENLKVPYPKYENERDKIGRILYTWDKAIELKEKLIEQKKELKKGLMQKLLTGEVRLPGFKGEWKLIKLGKIMIEINEKSTVNNQYQVLSVTKKGIIAQNKQFKKQVASKNNIGYKIIKKYNLVFSTMNLWMGSLDVLTDYDIGIVSPSYKVFEFNQNWITPFFAKYFMKSEHMIWIYNVHSEQGASVVRRNLDLNGLLNTDVKIPSIKEQNEIVKVLLSLEKNIELLEKELESIKLQKKGLMQLLLTGKVRVKV